MLTLMTREEALGAMPAGFKASVGLMTEEQARGALAHLIETLQPDMVAEILAAVLDSDDCGLISEHLADVVQSAIDDETDHAEGEPASDGGALDAE